MVKKDLVRSAEGQALARAVIKTVGNELDIVVREKREISFFREVLADEAIGVLIGASLPRGVRIGKEEIGT